MGPHPDPGGGGADGQTEPTTNAAASDGATRQSASPDNRLATPRRPGSSATSRASESDGAPRPEAAAKDEEDPVLVLRRAFSRMPEWPEIRAQILHDPSMVESAVSAFRERAPGLFKYLYKHQEAFAEVVEEGCGTETTDRYSFLGPFSASELDLVLPAHVGGAMHFQVSLTPVIPAQLCEEDNEVIERLMAMGFSKTSAKHAYSVAGKDEDLAANLLLDAGHTLSLTTSTG
eukprot:TRINITY_DN52427_c0_g1_i1.p1 TRINITY_DN52427_c0_g1~~TRINITY_DN52427_c0_g1_i1.p1  ORF type:complete len:260 (+),score=48.98 TRINITY_DN52427_c0_g1_i1:85-780(+)